jgi:signal transduction histidine kinase
MLALFVVTLVVSGAITYYVIKDIEIREYRRLLTTNIENAKFYVQGSSNFKQIVKDIKQDSGIRATIMDDKGIVLADSDADVIEIENQLNNEEVKEAFSNKYGEANRYSKTLQHKYLFLAKKVDIGIRSYILRLGVSTESIIRDFVGIWSIITIVFAFSSYIALLITFHLGNKFNAEITKIIKYLVQVINKNYNAKYKPDFTKEFQEIGQKFSKISNMAQSIDEERQNYTDKLQLLNQQQSDILSAVSHEFKNPIAAIMGYSQTLLDDIGIDKKIRRKFLGKITTNALKLTDLIDKLSLSFRFEKGDLKIKPETIDLVEMTNELKNDILQKHRHRGINVITQHPHIEIKADKTFIESVITNLLDNAIKYSEDDVTVSIDNKQIKFIDQGIGIKEKILQR